MGQNRCMRKDIQHIYGVEGRCFDILMVNVKEVRDASGLLEISALPTTLTRGGRKMPGL